MPNLQVGDRVRIVFPGTCRGRTGILVNVSVDERRLDKGLIKIHYDDGGTEEWTYAASFELISTEHDEAVQILGEEYFA